MEGQKTDLFSRLHPAITAAVAAAVIAVLALGYVMWRSSVATEPPLAAGPAAADEALEPTIVSPEESPSRPSPSPSAAGLELAPGTWSLESVDHAGRYVRRRDGRGIIGTIDAASGVQARNEATLVVSTGLADRSCFSFRMTDGRYLRHSGFRLRFDEPDGSDLFVKDATFCAEAGAGGDSVRLRSHNYPDRVIRHRDSELWLDRPDGSRSFSAASSFTVRTPLASS